MTPRSGKVSCFQGKFYKSEKNLPPKFDRRQDTWVYYFVSVSVVMNPRQRELFNERPRKLRALNEKLAST